MDDDSMLIEWDKFTKSIGGHAKKGKGNYVNPDNIYKIKTEKNEIELTWGNEPHRNKPLSVKLESILTYEIKNSRDLKFELYPTDFLSRILSSFMGTTNKTGIKELDKAYTIISNNRHFVINIKEELKAFHKYNTYKKFYIKIDTITDLPKLKIFIPELLTTQESLNYYYNLGLRLVSTIEQGKY